jgi:hypothetical protein
MTAMETLKMIERVTKEESMAEVPRKKPILFLLLPRLIQLALNLDEFKLT